ncbi:MAG: chorismate mutase [Fusobacteriaceae bacterium]
MLKLKELREKINFIDSEILKLLEERAEVVTRVGELKKGTNIPLYIPERESEILENISSKVKVIPKDSIKFIYREIISGCRVLEKKFNVLSIGELGLVVAFKIFGNSVTINMEKELKITELRYNDINSNNAEEKNKNYLKQKKEIIKMYEKYDFIIFSEKELNSIKENKSEGGLKIAEFLLEKTILDVELSILEKKEENYHIVSFSEVYKGAKKCKFKI